MQLLSHELINFCRNTGLLIGTLSNQRWKFCQILLLVSQFKSFIELFLRTWRDIVFFNSINIGPATALIKLLNCACAVLSLETPGKRQLSSVSKMMLRRLWLNVIIIIIILKLCKLCFKYVINSDKCRF